MTARKPRPFLSHGDDNFAICRWTAFEENQETSQYKRFLQPRWAKKNNWQENSWHLFTIYSPSLGTQHVSRRKLPTLGFSLGKRRMEHSPKSWDFFGGMAERLVSVLPASNADRYGKPGQRLLRTKDIPWQFSIREAKVPQTETKRKFWVETGKSPLWDYMHEPREHAPPEKSWEFCRISSQVGWWRSTRPDYKDWIRWLFFQMVSSQQQ